MKHSAIFSIPTELAIQLGTPSEENEGGFPFGFVVLAERNGKRLVDIAPIELPVIQGFLAQYPSIIPIILWKRFGGQATDEEGNIMYPFNESEYLGMLPDDEEGERPTVPYHLNGWGGWNNRNFYVEVIEDGLN